MPPEVRAVCPLEFAEHAAGLCHQAALVTVGEFRRHVLERHPGHFDHFEILIAQDTRFVEHEEVMDRLMDPVVFNGEPEVDDSEWFDYGRLDARLLEDLAQGGLLDGFTLFHVTLRK